MKTACFALVLSTLALTSVSAQTSSNVAAAIANRPVSGASARDGFTMRGTEMVVTRNGVTSKVEREFVFANGLRVKANGSITLLDGSSATLRPNQLLAFDGTIQDVLLTPDGVAPLSSVETGASPKTIAKPSPWDGISISGKDVFITRNGFTEKVTDDVRLPNGVTVRSDGTVVLGNGNTVILRHNQIVDLSGALREVPARSAPGR